MEPEQPHIRQRSPVWIWLDANGERWRIHHAPDGVSSCLIGLAGKRLGAWKAGLPPSLDFWPNIKNQE